MVNESVGEKNSNVMIESLPTLEKKCYLWQHVVEKLKNVNGLREGGIESEFVLSGILPELTLKMQFVNYIR